MSTQFKSIKEALVFKDEYQYMNKANYKIKREPYGMLEQKEQFLSHIFLN